MFYLIEYINSNFILDISILFKQNILINSKMQSWQFKILDKKLKIVDFKQFVLDFVKYSIVYTIVCVNITKILNKKLTKFEILKKLRNLKNIYNNKLAEILLKLKKEDYTIKLQNNKELLFIIFYNFLQNKLAILRQYLDNILAKNEMKLNI